MEKIIYQVDAFADKSFEGNPAGVLLNAEDLDEKQMLNIAREMALSETAFVIKSNEEEYDYQVRFFTPTKEVDLCGHATIATFFTMAEKGMLKPKNGKAIVKQKTLAGILPVEVYFDGDGPEKVMMTQGNPSYIFTLNKIDEIAKIMGLDICNIGLDGFEALPMAYSTGVPDIMLPVKTMDALKKINPNFEKLSKYSRDYNVTGVHAFTIRETQKPLISCRNFAPAYGIDEEAATGTSNGALSAYLIDNGIIKIDTEVDILCQQGYFMNRPSKIFVEVKRNKNDLNIKVGGRAVLVMEGKIYL